MSPSKVQEAARTSRSKRTWSVWVGVKAVKSCVPRRAVGAGVEERRDRARCGHQRARPRSNGLGARAGEDAVEVGARPGVAPGVEAVRDQRLRAVTATSSGPTPFRLPRQVAWHLCLGVEARHLPKRMHARYRSAQPRSAATGFPQHRRQRCLELPLHGPQPRLRCPAAETRARRIRDLSERCCSSRASMQRPRRRCRVPPGLADTQNRELISSRFVRPGGTRHRLLLPLEQRQQPRFVEDHRSRISRPWPASRPGSAPATT